jgi:hypothetical protein
VNGSLFPGNGYGACLAGAFGTCMRAIIPLNTSPNGSAVQPSGIWKSESSSGDVESSTISRAIFITGEPEAIMG